MFAGHRKLDNLVVILDNNGLQIDGDIAKVCSPYPLDEKFMSFNFNVVHADAHNFQSLAEAFAEARDTKGMPTAIIAKSIKGKGVSFMEDDCLWHGAAPSEEQLVQAISEVEKGGIL